MKALPKSLREANRYILVHIRRETSCTSAALLESIQHAVIRLVGTIGAAKAGLMLVNERCDYPYMVIKTDAIALDVVRSALCIVTSIDGSPTRLESVQVSGQINKLSIPTPTTATSQ